MCTNFALEMSREFQGKSHVSPRSVICHNSVMSACGKAQQWQLALQIFADLGGEATAVSLNTAINACKSSSSLLCSGPRKMDYDGL